MAGATVNDALVHIGEPKKYQFFILFWSLLAGAMTAMQSLVLNFTQASMSFRCKDDEKQMIFFNQSHGYLAASSNLTLISLSTAYQYDTCPNSTAAQCAAYVYNNTHYTSSVVSEFDLVCDNTIMSTVSDALFMVTRIPAGIVSGQLSDRLGRKRAIMIGLFMLGALGMGTAYSVNIYMYIVFHSLLSFPVMACYDGCATLISELTSPKKRPAMLIAIVFSWGTGIVLLSPFGYFIRDWRTLQMAISIPPFVLLLLSYWVFDESPHWLYSQGRYKEAQRVLDKMARWNNCKLVELSTKPLKDNNNIHAVTTPSLDEKPTHHTDADYSQEALTPDHGPEQPSCGGVFVQIIQSPRFLKIFLVCVFGWLACNMGYTGLAFGLGKLSGDPYIVNLIGGSTEYIAYIIAFLIIPGGRKKVYVILLSIGGISLIVNAVILDRFGENNGKDWLIILLTMIGRLSVAACWQILYLWCLELFPTTMRLTMLEVSMIVGHIGSTASPFINDAHKLIKNKAVRGQIIAPAVYGIFLILSSITSLYLPETNNRALPVDLEEAKRNIESTTRNRRRDAGVDHDENLSTYI